MCRQVAGLVPNVEVCDILLRQSRMNFSYKMYIMETMKTHRIRANASFVGQLERDIAYARKMVVRKVNICDLFSCRNGACLCFSILYHC